MPKEMWIALVAVVVELVLYFAAKYLSPELAEDIKFVIGVLQPFVLALIAWVFAERVAKFIRSALGK